MQTTITSKHFSRRITQDAKVTPVTEQVVLVEAFDGDNDAKVYMMCSETFARAEKKLTEAELVQALVDGNMEHIGTLGPVQKYGPTYIGFFMITMEGVAKLAEGGVNALGYTDDGHYITGKDLAEAIHAGDFSAEQIIGISHSDGNLYDPANLAMPKTQPIVLEVWGRDYDVHAACPVLADHAWVESCEVVSNPVYQNHSISGSSLLAVKLTIPQAEYEEMTIAIAAGDNHISTSQFGQWVGVPHAYGEAFAKHLDTNSKLTADPLGLMPFHSPEIEEDDDDEDSYSW